MGFLSSIIGGGDSGGMDDAIAYAQKIYNETKENVSPYIASGKEALPVMTKIATNLEESPLYKWQLNQETTAANKGLKARGLWNSGAGLRYLSDITNRVTAQEGGNMWNRLNTLAGFGLEGSKIQAGAGIGSANTYASLAETEAKQNLAEEQMGLQTLMGIAGMGAGMYSGSQYTSALQAILNSQKGGSLIR